MPLPKQIRFVTFDCYGSLIDWEAGVHKAFQKEADRDGFTVNKDELIPLFISVQREIQSGSYELYAEVLRRTAVRVAKEMGWELEPSRSSFLPDSVPSWMPFRETNAQLERLRKKYEIGILANIDDKLLGATRRHFRTDLDLVVTAQQVRSYKPDEDHFKECARRIGGKRGWVHIGSGYEPDIEPCLKRRVPVIWVNRSGEKLESNQKKPTETVKNLREAAKLLKAL
ncbi:MAG: haloacid dehalogenase [Thermoleophilaceae bacterium]|nr:haloacid dehalogenase [Thermoleophilaceae bacterium]